MTGPNLLAPSRRPELDLRVQALVVLAIAEDWRGLYAAINASTIADLEALTATLAIEAACLHALIDELDPPAPTQEDP